MDIAEQLRELLKAKNPSQADPEKLIGFSRCYISRIELGHTVPFLKMLGRFE
jgi:transcriptional regulator with XRE-family HTH domain